MSRLTQDGTAEPVSRDQILRRERGQGNINFPCSADHEQDWQPYPVDPYSAIHVTMLTSTYIYILIIGTSSCPQMAILPNKVVFCALNSTVRVLRRDLYRTFIATVPTYSKIREILA